MRKKANARKAKIKVIKHKNVAHYLKVYFLALLVAVVVYIGGTQVFVSRPPCANSLTCKSDKTEMIDNQTMGIFEGKRVVPPKIDLSLDFLNPKVLGSSDSKAEKHIYIDLSTQKLYAFDGSSQFMQTLIASGKWNPTPVGNFNIWEKLRATRMAGGEGADAYDLPNVPYVMYFYNDFGLHGAYWHNNFGHKMSHGCVNMRIVDARDLFNWANVGTPVSVCNHFTAPGTCEQ